MGVLKNGVGRPSNETIRKRNILKVVCIVLVLIIIGLIGYILNDKGIININKDNKKVKENNTKKEEKKISKEEAEKIMNNVLTDEWNLYIKYAGVDMFNQDLYKSIVAINKSKKSTKNYDVCSLYTCSDYGDVSDGKSKDFGSLDSSYEYSDVNKTFNKLFVKGKLVKDVYTDVFFWNRMVYNEDKNVYFKFHADGGDGPLPIISGVYKAYEKENTLHVIIVYETGKCDEECYININNNQINLYENGSESNHSNIINKYGKDMTKYDFSFEKTKDGYKFIKSSKLK